MKPDTLLRSMPGICLLCLCLVAQADSNSIQQQIAELRQQISERQQASDESRKAIALTEQQINEQQEIQNSINEQLQRFRMGVRRINVMSDSDSPENRQALKQLEFEISRARFNLQRSEETTEELENERREQRRQGRIIRGQLSILEEQLADLEQEQQAIAARQQAEQQKQALAEAARLEAEAKAEAEQQRLAQQREAEQVQEPEAIPEAEPAITANEAEATVPEATAAVEALISDIIPSDNYASFNTDDSDQQQVRRQLINSINRLPPAQSALTLAMATALESRGTQAVLGHNPPIRIANPVGTNPQQMGNMQHLGNNQYLLELRLQKGMQQFVIGDYSFTRRIPPHFDNIRSLLLLDLRNSKKPVFQLVVAGG